MCTVLLPPGVYPNAVKYIISKKNTNKVFKVDIRLLYTRKILAPLHPIVTKIYPYPTAFPYGNGMVLHFYQQQESSTTKTVHKVINKGLKTYV